MSTVHSFVLSAAAMDLLWEDLQLGSPPALFELASVGETMDDRARLRDLVYRDLASRGLVSRGRAEDDLAGALAGLVRFGYAIEGLVISDEPPLAFRAATDGRNAVLAAKHGESIRFTLLRPEGLVHEVLTLVGEEKAGRGASVSYPDAEPAPEPTAARGRHSRPSWPGTDEDEEGFGGVMRANQPTGGYEPQRRSAQDILAKPRTRSGWLTVLGQDRTGRETMAPPLAWFDTEDGRYLAHRRPGPDGRPWSTCTPADTTRLRHQLIELVNGVVVG